jgi:hypothetical protein
MEGFNSQPGYQQRQQSNRQESETSVYKMTWLKKYGKRMLIGIVVVIILYNWGCAIPIINILCPIFAFIKKIISGMGSVFEFANKGLGLF